MTTTRRKTPAKRNVGGRPTKRDERTENTIRAALQRGLAIETACDLAGVDSETVRRWRRADPGFERVIKEAIAQGRTKMAGRLVEQCDAGSVPALQFWLTRRCPEFRQAREQPVDLQVPEGATPREMAAAGIVAINKAAEAGAPPQTLVRLAESIERLVSTDEKVVTRAEFDELQETLRRAGITR